MCQYQEKQSTGFIFKFEAIQDIHPTNPAYNTPLPAARQRHIPKHDAKQEYSPYIAYGSGLFLKTAQRKPALA